MKYIANAVGVLAVILFVLSYQQKTRKGIVLCNVISRALYVAQYILLFAFEGAMLDVIGIAASILAQKKDTSFIKKNLKIIVVCVNLAIVVAGLLLYKNAFSLLPMFGVLLHTGAFWLTNEKYIRIVSFFGSPFWLVYNVYSMAYGSAAGDIMTMVSIGIAIFRYDILKKSSNNSPEDISKNNE